MMWINFNNAWLCALIKFRKQSEKQLFILFYNIAIATIIIPSVIKQHLANFAASKFYKLAIGCVLLEGPLYRLE